MSQKARFVIIEAVFKNYSAAQEPHRVATTRIRVQIIAEISAHKPYITYREVYLHYQQSSFTWSRSIAYIRQEEKI